MRARQGKVNDCQQHYHESIDKEWAISQTENVTEIYGDYKRFADTNSRNACSASLLRMTSFP